MRFVRLIDVLFIIFSPVTEPLIIHYAASFLMKMTFFSGKIQFRKRPCMIVFSGTEVRQRSEEHTSELQSRFDLVCRLLLEKKKNLNIFETHEMFILLIN